VETPSKIFYGALALLALGALGAGAAAAGAHGLAFALFAVLTLGGGLVCIWERSVVRSAFALLATFSGTAGFFLLLESDFLAVAQILIYVGGILALLLFGVMLTPPDLTERQLPRVLGGLLLLGAGGAWLGWKVARVAEWVGAPSLRGGSGGDPITARNIGVGFLAPDQYVIAFELAGVVLTVALVAAVYIARRRRSDYESESGAEP
jgi:NADH-quinone oxidoreductase subunit J